MFILELFVHTTMHTFSYKNSSPLGLSARRHMAAPTRNYTQEQRDKVSTATGSLWGSSVLTPRLLHFLEPSLRQQARRHYGLPHKDYYGLANKG